MKKSSHKPDINRRRRRRTHKYTKSDVSRLDNVYVQSATLKQQWRLNLLKVSNAENKLKKYVAY